MSGLDKNRHRNQTICFRMSPEERRQLEARIIVCGMSKNQYFIQSSLHQKIEIVLGKYQSDRLSLEMRRLRELIERLEKENKAAEVVDLLADCKALLMQLLFISGCGGDELRFSDIPEQQK